MPADPTRPVAAVLLAAGQATRMGRNKLLLEIGGRTLLRRAVEAAAAGGLEPVIVVLGHDAERAAAELAGTSCRTVFNADYAFGRGSSLRAGVGAVPAGAAAAVALLGDMPHVTAEMIAAVVARYRATGAPLVVSEYGDVIAPPVLYDRALFAEIAQLDARCDKRVVKRHLAVAERLAWPRAALADVDEPADYEALRHSFVETVS